MDIKALVRDVPDFPQPGILFRDITPVLQNAEAFLYTIDQLTEYTASRNPDAIVGIESRGFLFGAPVAARLLLPFVPVRKPGRLPSALMSVEYELEYGEGRLDIHSDGLLPGQSAVIIDDLIATGGTAAAAVELVGKLQGKVAGVAFLIELAGLQGRSRLQGQDVFSLVSYP